jgi:para-nitrobenzyl esterase
MREQGSGTRPGTLAMWTVVIAGLVLGACTKSPPAPEVTAGGETLQGAWAGVGGDIAVFKGIPFAAPPVGDLRWRAPRPHQPRQGAQAALEFAPACMQTDYIVDWYARIAVAFGNDAGVVGRPNGVSEDCLFLNIWTPSLAAGARLPVMIYVHGGSNKGGWSYEPNYVGDRLAKRGVVVVSIAYRLGPLGFFSHPALDNGAREPVANFGLLDIEQAFRWVRQNIENFGGDAGNITGFGESAGAGNLLMLALAGKDRDHLFERIIAQSTGASTAELGTLDEEKVRGHALVQAAGLGADAGIEQLRALPAADLVAAADRDLKGRYFSPVLDGLVLERQPLAALASGRGRELDLLIGTNADEWYMYIDPAIGREEVNDWIADTAPAYTGSLLTEVEGETDPRKAMDRLRTARETLCPSRYLAAAISAQGGQGFVYYFTRNRPGTGGDELGVYHGAELPYVFDQHDDWLPTDDTDDALSSAIMDYWSSFAKNGSPQATRYPGWPVFTASRQYVMELGDEVHIVKPHGDVLCRYLGPREK